MSLPQPTPTADAQLARSPGAGRARGSGRRCLVIHDELELRLRLAALVRKAAPGLQTDMVAGSAVDTVDLERLAGYAGVFLIAEFATATAATASLAVLERLRQRLPNVPVYVFARGGSERTAARSMKLGASDYWPVHSVIPGELAAALQPIIDPMPEALATRPGTDHWRQPEIAGYTLIRKIAQTDMASVYVARNPEFEQPIALKVQSTRRLRDGADRQRARFMRECEILSRLNHRAVADILDFGVSDEFQYLALEYFPCGSLRDRLRHPISESDAHTYARQIGEALQVVHAANIVHRDLKPSNLMLTEDNRLVLIDFGSARASLSAGDPSGRQDFTGTPYYACPEQVDDREPDARGDLYSLGVVFYELLVGRVPFQGRSVAEILDAHRSQAIPRLPRRFAAYQAVFEQLLAKRPEGRFAQATDFLNALDAVCIDRHPRSTNTRH